MWKDLVTMPGTLTGAQNQNHHQAEIIPAAHKLCSRSPRKIPPAGWLTIEQTTKGGAGDAAFLTKLPIPFCCFPDQILRGKRLFFKQLCFKNIKITEIIFTYSYGFGDPPSYSLTSQSTDAKIRKLWVKNIKESLNACYFFNGKVQFVTIGRIQKHCNMAQLKKMLKVVFKVFVFFKMKRLHRDEQYVKTTPLPFTSCRCFKIWETDGWQTA